MKQLFGFFLLMLCWPLLSAGQQEGKPLSDSIPFREVNIPLEIQISCEQQKYQVVWDIKNIDSSDLPRFMLLKGYRFEEGDTNRIPYRTQFIDSTTLFSLPYVWIGSPGYYWLEARDSLRKIHYSSDKIR
ncbi:MAG: hypothetical protein LPK45_05190, partial [Bacteroidota bacterium]|nr:hypothetical protein [Bacteroidota bacterium]MDX5469214.1 hypothetical protein [Bacteroidota bacterium]